MQLLRFMKSYIRSITFIPNGIYFECLVACQLCKYSTIACTCEIFNSMMLTEMPQFNTVLY